jgi:hypothetical protein
MILKVKHKTVRKKRAGENYCLTDPTGNPGNAVKKKAVLPNRLFPFSKINY